jgi:ribosomal protein L11 methyltransferase
LISCQKLNLNRRQQIKAAKTSIGPDGDLFIYYLKGRLKAGNGLFQNNFIGNWEEEDDSFLFFSSPALLQIQALLNNQRQLSYVDSYEMSYDQWLGEVFKTYEHGKFCITPRWEFGRGGTFSDKIRILLDPGLVFGTGTHPTTRDCLEALETAAGLQELNTTLDLGSGTGLLSLAAARLGSKHVVAVDLNFLAAKTTAENVSLNQLEDRVMTIQGRAEDAIDYPADLVIANIHYDVMRQLIEAQGFLDKKRFVLSGLLRSEAKDVADRLARHPAQIKNKWTRDGIWYTFYGEMEQIKSSGSH